MPDEPSNSSKMREAEPNTLKLHAKAKAAVTLTSRHCQLMVMVHINNRPTSESMDFVHLSFNTLNSLG